MRVRTRNRDGSWAEGSSSAYNMHSINEIVVHYDDGPDGEPGGADSVFVRDIEVWIERTRRWTPLGQAFRDRDVLPNNENTRFSEARTDEDRERGYTT
jgi:hypothetical protein